MAKLMSPLSEAGRTVGWTDTVTPPHFSPISRSSDQNRNPQQSSPTDRDGRRDPPGPTPFKMREEEGGGLQVSELSSNVGRVEFKVLNQHPAPCGL